VCEKEGFEITGMYRSDIWHITKKDPWGGVEFAQYKYHNLDQFPFFRIKSTKGEYLVTESGSELFKGNCQPMTELAYVAQLKKEAIKRGIISICNLDISMMHGGELEDKSTELKYRKDT